jgi:hypothetical protein
MPVGLSNLVTGLTQGLAIADQKKRQDVLDAREAERFDMQKQQFADQQKASDLAMQTNQFNLTNAQSEAARKKLLQEEADNFHKTMKGYFAKQATGDYRGFYTDLENDKRKIGINGQFLRDAQGNIVIDDKGNATWTDGTKAGTSVLTPDSALESFYNSYNPEKAVEARMATRSEIDKEQRQHNNQVKLSGVQTDNAIRLKKETERYTPRSLSFVNTETGTFGVDPITGKTIEIKTPDGKPVIKSTTKGLTSKDYEPYLPLAQNFFGSTLKSDQLKQVVDKLTKEQFISSGLDSFKANNVGKFMRPSEMEEVEQSLNNLADNLYGASGVTQSTSGGQQNTLTSWIKSQNITNENQAADTIRTLREKGWSDEQINAAFDELGL